MNELQIFKSPEFGQVRIIVEDDKILFCASDVANALGYARPADAVSKFCPHTVKRRIGVETGIKADGTPAVQNVQMNFIPEGDVYRLVVRSKLPTAIKF
ncbi:BRO-N domain-containing protein [Megamonas funiformis]|uniref:BRO-N domain-containing protein n=1 Tax=Megamonas funiformis TaxID=437897 RepID=UPI00402737F8